MLAGPKPGDGGRPGGSRVVDFRMVDTSSCAALIGHEGIFIRYQFSEGSPMDFLNSALGGAGYVGDTLDKYTGGRALRGLAAGKGRELASVLPFSDSPGLTDE